MEMINRKKKIIKKMNEEMTVLMEENNSLKRKCYDLEKSFDEVSELKDVEEQGRQANYNRFIKALSELDMAKKIIENLKANKREGGSCDGCKNNGNYRKCASCTRSPYAVDKYE